MFSTRLLTEEDVTSFRSLRLESFREAPHAFSESYEDEKKRNLKSFKEELAIMGMPPEHFVLGIFLNQKELVGFVKFRRDQRSKARHKSMIHAMYVAKNYRNQNLGRLLIEELMKRIRSLEGLEQVHLWVLHFKRSAANFYRSCGFIAQGPLVKKDLKVNGDYVDAEYMVMYLNE